MYVYAHAHTHELCIYMLGVSSIERGRCSLLCTLSLLLVFSDLPVVCALEKCL